MIQFTRGTQDRQIHRPRRYNEIYQGLQESEMRSYFVMATEFPFGMIKKKDLKMDSSDGCTTLWMCITPLNCTPKNT